MYDIGMVYKKNGRYYLAVDSQKLLTFVKGKPVLYKARTALQKDYTMSVRELCDAWGISVDTLDRVTAQYLLEKFKEATAAASPSATMASLAS